MYWPDGAVAEKLPVRLGGQILGLQGSIMKPSRRDLVAGALAIGGAAPAPAIARAAAPLPHDFLWGAAISGHQSEGNNTNSDSWLRENLSPTLYAERSGDACDSYHRFGEDIAIAARLGFNCYRFGIEW